MGDAGLADGVWHQSEHMDIMLVVVAQQNAPVLLYVELPALGTMWILGDCPLLASWQRDNPQPQMKSNHQEDQLVREFPSSHCGEPLLNHRCCRRRIRHE